MATLILTGQGASFRVTRSPDASADPQTSPGLTAQEQVLKPKVIVLGKNRATTFTVNNSTKIKYVA